VKRFLTPLLAAALLASSGFFAYRLGALRPGASPVLAESAFAFFGGLRSIAAEIIWFRADRLQEEGRYVELAQLASALTLMEPHTPEVWSYAAWNLAYNVSVMMPTHEDRWRWVHAALRLLRDEGLALNPDSPEICSDLGWLFEVKLGTEIDAAAGVYRREWRKIVEDVATRGAWSELKMDPAEMRRIEDETGLSDWGDPLLSAIYWGARGRNRTIVAQSLMIYRRLHAQEGPLK